MDTKNNNDMFHELLEIAIFSAVSAEGPGMEHMFSDWFFDTKIVRF